jgi:hypothetical protein
MWRTTFLFLTFVAIALICIAQAQEIEFIGSISTYGSSGVVIDGDYAYIIGIDSLLIMNIANPSNPSYTGSLYFPEQPLRLDVQGNYAYIADADSGLQIADVSNPQSPAIIGRFLTPVQAEDIVVDGLYAYLMDDAGLRILDISNPTVPIELSFLNYWYGGGIAKKDSIVYVIFWDIESDIMEAIDVTIPTNPRIIAGAIVGSMHCSRLYINGNRLFAVNGPYYFHIWDISDPSIFNYQSGMSLTGLTDICADSNYAFASIGQNGLSVIDISQPDTSYEVLRYDTPGNAEDITISGNYLYVADSSSLRIYRFYPTAIDEPSILPTPFSLSQNYPNPFNAQTTIQYSLPSQSPVAIEIFDILGRKIETLAEGIRPAGNHQATWDARWQTSGIYFYKMKADKMTETKKMIIAK